MLLNPLVSKPKRPERELNPFYSSPSVSTCGYNDDHHHVRTNSFMVSERRSAFASGNKTPSSSGNPNSLHSFSFDSSFVEQNFSFVAAAANAADQPSSTSRKISSPARMLWARTSGREGSSGRIDSTVTLNCRNGPSVRLLRPDNLAKGTHKRKSEP